MTTLVVNYIANPFANFGRKAWEICEVIGYSRAAAELARQGLIEESKNCMMQIAKIKASN